MLKKLVSALALLGCSAAAVAAPQAYEWSFKGATYLDVSTGSGIYDPDVSFKGGHVVDDRNADGIYQISEIISLNFNGHAMVGCTLGYGDTSAASGCRIAHIWEGGDAFASPSYFRDADLYWWSTENGIRRSEWFNGIEYGYGEEVVATGQFTYRWWYSPHNVVFAPVPEPESWLMLGAGLGLLGALGRRRAVAKSA